MSIGVYIDMEMPQNCQSCNFYNGLGCKATGKMFAMFYNVATRRNDCPLIEVPEPHGRLIDADALIADLKRQCKEVFRIDAVSPDDFWITRDHAYNERLWKTWCESFFEYLKGRDTVIPASEEAE